MEFLTQPQKMIMTVLFTLMISLFILTPYYFFIDLTINTQDNIYISSTRSYLFSPDKLIMQKYDSNGRQLWNTQLPLSEEAVLFPAFQTSDASNNIYLITAGNIHKYTPDGQHLWSKATPDASNILHIRPIGEHLQTWVQHAETHQLLTQTYDPKGNLNQENPIPIPVESQIFALGIDSNEQIIYIDPNSVNQYHPTGELQWSHELSSISYGSALKIDAEDNIYLSDIGYPDEFRKYSPTGQLLWSKINHPTQPEQGVDIVNVTHISTNTINETVQIFGRVKNYYNDDQSPFKAHLFIFRFTQDGRTTWHQTTPAKLENADNTSMQIDSAGNTYISGHTTRGFHISPTLFLRKYDPSGQLIWYKQSHNYLLYATLLYYLAFVFFHTINGGPAWHRRVFTSILLGILHIIGLFHLYRKY